MLPLSPQVPKSPVLKSPCQSPPSPQVTMSQIPFRQSSLEIICQEMCCFPFFLGFFAQDNVYFFSTYSVYNFSKTPRVNGGKQTEITADMQFKLNNVKGQGASQAPRYIYAKYMFLHDCFALTIISHPGPQVTSPKVSMQS